MRTHLDLFSGIGGFSLAAQANGFTTIAFCEIDPYAQQILIEKFGAVLSDSKRGGCGKNGKSTGLGGMGEEWKNYPMQTEKPSPRLHPDIFALDGTQYWGVDLLTGGFPCQPFSVAGKRRGAEDDRALWPEMFRIIREAEPAAVLAENVPGIINMELDHCLSDLEGIGYACWPIVVPACAVDARHRRDRVWIVAHRRSINGWARNESRGSGLEIGDGGEDVANDVSGGLETATEEPRQKRPEDNASIGTCTSICCRWEPEPNVGRVAHGVSARTHRLRALGNAIVPKVAEEIIRCMMVTGMTET